jgi:glycosyltransferase involved in cell wall biosynthesis
MRVGIFDHLSLRLGGAQLVAAWIAAVLSRRADVELIHSGQGYRLPELAAAFGVDLGCVKERVIGNVPRTFARSMRNDMREERRFDRELTAGYDLFVYSGHGVPPYSWAARAMAYCQFPFEASPDLTAQDDPRWGRRLRLDRWVRLQLYRRRWRRRLSRYQVIANSRFTASWIERLWGVPAEALYPPVNAAAPPRERGDVIATLGRFVRSDRKGMAAQIEAFDRVRSRLPGAWRLVMMGFCADLPGDREALERLRRRAAGLPVGFVVNAPRQEILNQLAAAKLFWHTAGLEDLASTEPRYLEHFGIATAEAMQLGCVPIVPAGGGQPEIVEHAVSGFVCEDFESLERRTVELAADEPALRRMSEAALRRGARFGPADFERRLAQLLGVEPSS